ncbi:hypothetical protein BN1211_1723 [Cyberlindnera jadinii]|uniref:Uncharacterized protein n=1 Tax=Cyberlindnera jadinii (strain ATCC 18201 / CBS 1600 / BCRC 20928 / JCM 3617 / NBRC 0987 / NRRL Y-1542) TaxID=983966 RepID=A0A0H5C1D3_CYBJN|nr:hypothetical protein BN1211_1723 [Cyberlindnera jadinii]
MFSAGGALKAMQLEPLEDLKCGLAEFQRWKLARFCCHLFSVQSNDRAKKPTDEFGLSKPKKQHKNENRENAPDIEKKLWIRFGLHTPHTHIQSTVQFLKEYVAIKLGFWTDGLSIHDIPEHCAHVYVKVSVSYQNEINQVDYKLEFSPEEYSKDQPEFGTDLRFLKRKVYFLVKDSKIYKELNEPFFRIDDVTLYYNGEQLTEHSKPLIQLGVRTGDTVAATVEIS